MVDHLRVSMAYPVHDVCLREVHLKRFAGKNASLAKRLSSSMAHRTVRRPVSHYPVYWTQARMRIVAACG